MKIITDLFQDDGGKWSLSRFCSAACVLSAIAWVSYVLLMTHREGKTILPDLTGPSFWVGTGGALHYGVGKYMDIFKAKLGLPTGNP